MENRKKYLSAGLFGICMSLMSGWYLVGNGMIEVFLTYAVSFGCGVYLFLKKWEEVIGICRQKTILSIVTGIIMAYMTYQIALELQSENVGYMIAGYGALLFVALLVVNYVRNEAVLFWKDMNEWDRKTYGVCSIFSLLLILGLYLHNSGWYLQYDNVYSVDSGWCFESIYPEFGYYDIRHPLLGVLTYPVFTVAQMIYKIPAAFGMGKIFMAVILQFINVQYILLSAFMIKKISDDSKEIFWLYLCSYSTILYLLFFEKYQLCTFILVFFVYKMCRKQRFDEPIIAATSVMPTSVALATGYLLVKEDWKKKVKTIFRIIMEGFAVAICFGRCHILFEGLKEIKETTMQFGSGNWTFGEKLISFSKLIQGVFVPVEAGVDNVCYIWRNITTSVDLVFFVVITLVILGLVVTREKLFSRVCALWMLFGYVLIVLVKWSVGESPLFSFYFGWAVVPMLKFGVDYLIRFVRMKAKLVYGFICLLFLLLAVADLMAVDSYLKILY